MLASLFEESLEELLVPVKEGGITANGVSEFSEAYRILLSPRSNTLKRTSVKADRSAISAGMADKSGIARSR